MCSCCKRVTAWVCDNRHIIELPRFRTGRMGVENAESENSTKIQEFVLTHFWQRFPIGYWGTVTGLLSDKVVTCVALVRPGISVRMLECDSNMWDVRSIRILYVVIYMHVFPTFRLFKDRIWYIIRKTIIIIFLIDVIDYRDLLARLTSDDVFVEISSTWSSVSE